MKQNKKLLSGLLLSFLAFFLSGCNNDYSDIILREWKVDKLEFLTLIDDSTKVRKETEKATITFLNNNKYISKRLVRDNFEKGTGSYRIEGKWLIEKNDTAEILNLKKKQLAIKMQDAMIVYFSKVEN